MKISESYRIQIGHSCGETFEWIEVRMPSFKGDDALERASAVMMSMTSYPVKRIVRTVEEVVG